MSKGANIYNVCGLMSGTSLDGLDLALCRFRKEAGHWHYDILAGETMPYSNEWYSRLKSAASLDAPSILQLHLAYGNYLGSQAKQFITRHGFECNLIASHGHTIFHQPEAGFTFQLGDGQALAIASEHKVVSDFRTADVLKGGQGAPLVPIGDAHLFSEYEACLNIGGFANISYTLNNRRIAFDICPANKVLNHYAGILGKAYDPEGQIAASGKIIPELLAALDVLPYYAAKAPKSLGEEWLHTHFFPLANAFAHAPADLLHTLTHHIARVISIVIRDSGIKSVLLSGGGALNSYLVSLLREACPECTLAIAETQILHYKEALIFAFLGLLRLLEEPNVLASVTGAANDHCSGLLSLP